MSNSLPLPHIRQRTRRASTGSDLLASTAAIGRPSEPRLQLVERPIADLKPSPRHARRHAKSQIARIASSIDAFGFNTPILIEASGEIIAGHARFEAGKKLGLTSVPVIVLTDLSEERLRAFRIADNKTADGAEWVFEVLKTEFEFLGSIDIDLPELTGFATAEIELVLDGRADAVGGDDPADQLPEKAESATSRIGDLWLLGDHRLYCGDAKGSDSYATLLGGEQAQLVFVDVPYNLQIQGCVSGLGRAKHREFAEASGEMSASEFRLFLTTVFERLIEASADGSIHFTCISWHFLHELMAAGLAVYDELKNVICWAKTNGGMGSFYRSQHELIPVWKKGKAPHINNIDLGRHGRYRTNVWTYAGANTFRRGRMEDLEAHPTVKPTALVMDAIKDCSKPDGIVLDAFGGSGTTLIAAAKTRRRGYLIEIDPVYVDLTIRRWQDLFKAEARHAATGLTFAEMVSERAGAALEETGNANADAAAAAMEDSHG